MLKVAVDRAQPGMVTARNVFNGDGRLLLGADITLTSHLINRMRNSRIGSIYIKNPHFEEDEVPEVLREETRVKAIKTIRQAFNKIPLSNRVEVGPFQGVAKAIVDEVVLNRNTMVHLTDIRVHDDYTFGHSVSVCLLVAVTGIGLGYNDQRLRELATGGLLHDLGKMMVPSEILNKNGRLTDDEMTVVKRHSEWGFEVLRKNFELPLPTSHIAFQHHEKFDGSGYPRGLRGRDIHEYARITAIADVYDALVSDRPYRKGMLPHEAYEILMASANSHFDLDILKVFFKQIAIYPVGSVVLLNTGQVAVVREVRPDLQSRPKVVALTDKQGKLQPERIAIDLAQQQHLTTFVSKVLRAEDIFALSQRVAKAISGEE